MTDKVRTFRVAVNSSAAINDTQDLTLSGFGTVHMAMITATLAQADGAADHAMLSIGFCTASAQVCFLNRSDHGEAATDATRRGETDSVFRLLDTLGGTTAQAHWSAFITDGVRIQYSIAPDAEPVLLEVTLFFLDVGVSINLLTSNATSGGTAAVSGLAFQPTAFIVLGNGSAVPGSGADARLSIGLVADNSGIEQACIAWGMDDNDAPGGTSSYGITNSNRCGVIVNQGSGAITTGLECTAFNSDGGTFTTRDASAAAVYAVVSLGFTLGRTVVEVESPTATGNAQVVTGFEPQWALQAMGNLTARANTSTGGANAAALALGFIDEAHEGCMGIAQLEPFATTTVAKSVIEDRAVYFYDDTAAAVQHAADFVSLDVDGYTLNYATVDGTVRKWIAFAVEGGASTPVLSSATQTSIAETTATVGCSTDTGTGELFVFVSTSATPPSAADLKAGTGAVFADSTVDPGTGAETFSVTGLTKGTTYYSHFIFDAGADDSNILTSSAWATQLQLTSPTAVADTVTAETGNTADLSFSTNGPANGTAYWYISTSATPPSASDLKDGTSSVSFGNAAVSGTGVQTFSNVGALADGTTYYAYFLHRSTTPTDSAILASSSFATAALGPTLSAATGSVASATSADLSVATTHTNGTLWTVVTTSATQPSVAQIKAGQDHLGAAATYAANDATPTNPQLFTATGLTTGVGYFAHFYQEDSDAHASNRITSNSFTPTAAGEFNIDGFSPGIIRPGDTVTANISGAWSGVGMFATIDGHPVTLDTQSATEITFTTPTFHTNPTFVDTPYGTPQVFALNDGGNNQTKNITISPPSGYDFVQIASIGGIWANDSGVAVNDDHLGHFTAGTGDPITVDGIINNIATFPATYVYWRFDESEQVWTASATETFYETPAFTGSDYADAVYFEGVAIVAVDLAASFNVATANIDTYAEIGNAVPGLTLDTGTGALTGTPTTAGIYAYAVRATDADLNTADSNSFTVTVYEAPVWIATPTNQNWVEGQVVSVDLAALINSNGLGPATTWSQLAGTLPTGVTLNTSTGVISGTVDAAAAASSPYNGQSFQASNDAGDTAMPDTFDIVVTASAPIFSGTISNFTVTNNIAMSANDVSARWASGGVPSSYSLNGAPTGLSINSSGVISGTAAVAVPGPFVTTVTATNANGSAVSNSFTITVATVQFVGPALGPYSWDAGVPITPVDISAEFEGELANGYSLQGTWPTGISINGSGVISGTPTNSGSFPGRTVRASNGANTADSNAITITVAALADLTAPVVTSAPGVASRGDTALGISAVATDNSGLWRIYAVVVADAAGAPSAAQVKAGTDSADADAPNAFKIDIPSGVRATLEMSALVELTAYDVYVLITDADDNDVATHPVKLDISTVAASGGGGGGDDEGIVFSLIRNLVDLV